MAETGRILLELFIAFVAAKAAGELFERIGQPAVIGELLAGIVLGPSLLGWVRPDLVLQTVGTIGGLLLLFGVGLETRVSDLRRVGATASMVAVVGVIVPFVLGYGYFAILGRPTAQALFVGAALTATSVGITARVLADAGLITTRAARVILAAAIMDDILGLLVLAGITGLARGRMDPVHLVVVAAMAAAFVTFQLLLAPRLVAHGTHLVDRLRIRNAPLVVAIVVLLGLSALSESLGLAAIVGAFFAGMMAAETGDRWSLSAETRPLADFLVPFFFVLVGVQVDVRMLVQPAVLVPGLVLTAIAIVSKVIGCGAGAWREGWREALAIGVGMVPRGEVGLIVAAVGLSTGIVPPSVYAMVVFVAVVTTVVVPPLIPPVFRLALTRR